MFGSDIREQDIPRKHVEADFESGETWPITREGMSFARAEKVAGIWKGGFISHREGRGSGRASISREYVVTSDR